MLNKREVVLRENARIRAARVNVKVSAKLGLTPELRIIEIAEKSLSGDEFSAKPYLKD